MVVTSGGQIITRLSLTMTVVVRTYQFAGVPRPTLTLARDVVTRGRVITFTFLTAAGPECPSRTGISAHSALQIITVKNNKDHNTGHTGVVWGSISSYVLYRENSSKHVNIINIMHLYKSQICSIMLETDIRIVSVLS